MLTRLAVAVLVLAAVPLRTMAADTIIGTAAIHLPPPRGFCPLLESNAPDKRLLTTSTDLAAKAGNKLLAMFVDCGQLAAWRGGNRLLDDYANYQTPLATMGSGPQESIQQTCATLRAEGDKILANQLPDLKARVEKSVAGVKVNEASFIGVLAEESRACYGGMLQKLRTALNTDKTQVILFAATIVRNKSIFVYRFAVYANPDSVAAALANLKSDVAELYATNK